MAKSTKDVPGNSVASAAAVARECARYGERLLMFEAQVGRWFEAGYDLLSLTVRLPQSEGGEYLVILRANVEGVGMVGFSSGATLASALETLVNRMSNGSLNFQEDRYAKK